MEKVGTIGNASNQAGIIYKTKAGNYIDAPSVDGRKTDIKKNNDGTYHVTVTKNGEVSYEKNLTEEQLVHNFGADISTLVINNGTQSSKDAQNKYGDKVANNFFAVA